MFSLNKLKEKSEPKQKRKVKKVKAGNAVTKNRKSNEASFLSLSTVETPTSSNKKKRKRKHRKAKSVIEENMLDTLPEISPSHSPLAAEEIEDIEDMEDMENMEDMESMENMANKDGTQTTNPFEIVSSLGVKPTFFPCIGKARSGVLKLNRLLNVRKPKPIKVISRTKSNAKPVNQMVIKNVFNKKKNKNLSSSSYVQQTDLEMSKMQKKSVRAKRKENKNLSSSNVQAIDLEMSKMQKKSVTFDMQELTDSHNEDAQDINMQLMEFYKTINEEPSYSDINESVSETHSIAMDFNTSIENNHEIDCNAIDNNPGIDLSSDFNYYNVGTDCNPADSNTATPHFYLEEMKPYVGFKSVGDGSLLVALLPDTKIFLSGYYYLKLIVGSVSVFGYKFKKGERHLVSSPPSHSILSINALEGVAIKSYDEERLREIGIPFEWIHDLSITENLMVAVVELRKYESSMTRLLIDLPIFRKMKSDSFDIDIWKELVGVHLIEDREKDKWCLLNESEEWSPYLDNLHSHVASKKDLHLVVTGGRSLGKSTFMKIAVNSLLSQTHLTEVACLDLDPGQSEFSVATCLSLSVINSPLLGPSFALRGKPFFSYQKTLFFGFLDVRSHLVEYLKMVSELIAEYRNLRLNVPLIVNTMGFTVNTGYDIMIDILRDIKPTHIVTFESSTQHENFPFQLHPHTVSVMRRGVLTKPGGRLNYDFTIFMTVASKKGGSKPAKLLRELNLLGYLSGLWENDEENICYETCKPPVRIDWTTVAIHVEDSAVPHTHVLQSINAALVALCKVDKEYLVTVDPNMPLQVRRNYPWNRASHCLGFGVVKGIDPQTREIHILTPLTPDQMYEVNLLSPSPTVLPTRFQNIFSSGKAPYWQYSLDL